MKSTGYTVTLFICILNTCILAQDTTKLIKYTPSYRFHEGIYLNFEQVRQNKPILKSSIVSEFNTYEMNYFEKLVQQKTIVFYDSYGVRTEISTEQLWGFCRKGAIYINYGGDFNRIPVLGSICHFVAMVTVYQDQVYNPYYSNYYNYNSPRQASTEMIQFLLDFETGKILEFNTNNMTILLSREPELLNEYEKLRRRKKTDQRFFYLRKYNEIHPLYLPAK